MTKLDDTAQAATAEQEPESSGPEAEGPSAVNEKRREAQAKAARKRRVSAKLKKSDLSDAELEQLHAILDKRSKTAAASNEPTAVGDGLPPEVQAQVAQLANVDSKELAALFWVSIDTVFLSEEKFFKGRYALNEKKRKALIDATGPVLDKYLPAVGNTPEAQLFVVLGVVFGPPALEHLLEPKAPGLVTLDAPEKAAA